MPERCWEYISTKLKPSGPERSWKRVEERIISYHVTHCYLMFYVFPTTNHFLMECIPCFGKNATRLVQQRSTGKHFWPPNSIKSYRKANMLRWREIIFQGIQKWVEKFLTEEMWIGPISSWHSEIWLTQSSGSGWPSTESNSGVYCGTNTHMKILNKWKKNLQPSHWLGLLLIC